MQILYLFIISMIIILSGCSKIRDSAGVSRKSIDELQIVETPPLIIPPDFNLLPPNQLKEKNINDVDKDLAEEILFGLNKKEEITEKEISTMKTILLKAEAVGVSPLIREEINSVYASEIETDSIFGFEWENEIEVLDAIKESERIRENNFYEKPISKGDIPTTIKKIKKKKKKRFIIF